MGCNVSKPHEETSRRGMRAELGENTSTRTSVPELGTPNEPGIEEDKAGVDGNKCGRFPFDASRGLQPRIPLLSERGVLVSWLLEFYTYAIESLGAGPDVTTKEVVESIIKRDTQDCRYSYLELAGVESGAPKYFISHTWSQPFRHVVECVRQRLGSQDGASVWLDIFALSQHQQEDPEAAQQLLCDLQDLKGAVQGMQHTFVVVDPKGTVFTRAWCLLEMHAAAMAGAADAKSCNMQKDHAGNLELLPYSLELGDASSLSKVMFGVDVMKAQAYHSADRKRILDGIAETVGCQDFNLTLKTAFSRAVADMVKRFKPGSRERAHLATVAGLVLADGGHLGEAERLLRESVKLNTALYDIGHESTLASINALGNTLRERGMILEAEEVLQAALEQCKSTLGEDHASTAMILHNLAAALVDKGELQRAEALEREALGIRQRISPSADLDIASSLNNLCAHLQLQGRLAEAEDVCRQALAIREEALGHHPVTAVTISNLAVLLENQGNLSEAESLHRKALAMQQATLGDRHHSTATTVGSIAVLLYKQGRLDEAEEMYRDELAILVDALGKDHSSVAAARRNLGLLMLSKGNLAEAEDLCREALAIERAAAPKPNPVNVAQSLNKLVAVLLAKGNTSEAEPLATEAIELNKEALGPTHGATLESMGNYAQLLEGQQSWDMAAVVLRKIIKTKVELLGPDGSHEDVLPIKHQLASVLRAQGKLEEVQELMRDILHTSKNTLESNDADVATSAVNLGGVLHQMGRLDEAEASYREGLDMYERIFSARSICIRRLAWGTWQHCSLPRVRIHIWRQSACVKQPWPSTRTS